MSTGKAGMPAHKDEHVRKSVYLPVELVETIEALADELGLNFSRALAQHLKETL